MSRQHVWASSLSRSFLVVAIVASSSLSASCAFIASPNPMWTRRHAMPLSRPAFSRAFHVYALPEIGSMKAGEMRKELESYGISTKSFFEKKEFKEALKKARAEGKKPKAQASTSSSSSEKKKSASSSEKKESSSGSEKKESASGSEKKESPSGKVKKEPASANEKKESASASEKREAASASEKKEPASASEKKEPASASTKSRDERIKEEMEKAKKMKISELKKELKDMGISTKSFFEKSEFVKALAEGRVDGVKRPKGGGARVQEEERDPKAQASTSSSSSSSEKKESASGSTKSRDERIKEETEKAKKMKISELRKELKEMGISTKSFFEKSEFVRALAEARVDGVKRPGGGGTRAQEEEFDPSYRDVVMQKFKASPRELVGSPVIDIQLR